MVLVVYMFLQGWRATLIPLLAVPVSLIGTFAVFPMLGFSINTLSLFGLVLAIGLVVDDAIVVVEAVERHIEEGMSPRDAAIKAMEEVSGPVIAIALILARYSFPTVFIRGITGRLYQQFAVTIAISVIFSAFNALSLSPALSALLLKPKENRKKPGLLGRFFNWFNRMFARVTDGYVGISAVLIRKAYRAGLAGGHFRCRRYDRRADCRLRSCRRKITATFTSVCNCPMRHRCSGRRRPRGRWKTSFCTRPGVQGCTSVIGFSLLSRVQNTYSAFFFVTEKPWDERKKPEEQYDAIRNHITAALSKMPDGVAFSFSPPAIPGVGTAGGVTFMLEDRSGADLTFLTDNVNKFVAAARKRPELTGMATSYLPDVPQEYVDVDRAKVERQQVNIADVYQTLGAFHGRISGQLLQPLRPAMAGLCRGRRRLPDAHRKSRPVLCG